MKFCDVCQNMLYMEVVNEDDTKLRHYCKNCKFTRDEVKGAHSIVVAEKSQFDPAAISYKNFINPSIKHDPTLPRVKNIDCPSCDITPREVIYIKYDYHKMKYLYHCCNCEKFWLSDTDKKI